jgi:hypothetical protein
VASLGLFLAGEASSVTVSWLEVVLDPLLGLESTIAFETSDSNSDFGFEEIVAAFFCSSSNALSAFSCSTFACLNIASISTSSIGFGLLICLFLQMINNLELQLRLNKKEYTLET